MKEFRNGLRNATALLLCLALLAGIFALPALSEMSPATPTDLAPAEEPVPQPEQAEEEEPAESRDPETPSEPGEIPTSETPSESAETPEPETPSAPEAGSVLPASPEAAEPFSQTETADNVRITVTADAGVFPVGTVLTITAVNDADVNRAAEAALGITSGSDAILLHTRYRISCDTMKGSARVSVEQLGLTGLQTQYPGAAIRVFVLRYNQADRSAQLISSSTEISADTVTFILDQPGLYDILTWVQPAAAEAPAEELAETPVEEQSEPEQPEPVVQPAEPRAELSTAPSAENSEETESLPASDPIPTDSISAFVARCYRLILGREPDSNGIRYWADLLRSRKKTAAEVISGFLESTEFSRMRKSPEELVDIMYQAMLDRRPDFGGKKYWLSIINDGASVAQLVNGFCNSDEFKGICAGYGITSGSVPEKGSDTPSVFTHGIIAFVTRCYQVALNRDPEPEGLTYWCKRLMSGKSSYKDVAEGFMFSNEMNQRQLSDEAFIRKLYHLYLDRDADSEGLQYWLANLNNGMSRKDANKGFAASREFNILTTAFELESSHLIIANDTELTIKNGGKTQLTIDPEIVPAGAELVWSSSDEKIFTVSQSGNLFGVYPGQAKLTIAQPTGQVIKTLNITVQANYRAVLFSISTYGPEGTFYRNQGDVRVMKNALASVTGPDGGEYTMHSFDNLTADQTYEKIADYLVAPSRDGDVSLFFMASHGDPRSPDQYHAGRLWCKDRATWIPLPRLAEKLSVIEGKVIVIIQSCGTGAAIYDFDAHELSSASGSPEESDAAYEQEMSAAVTSAFAAADPGLEQYQPAVLDDNGGLSKSPNKFRDSKFVVMTACGYMEWSKFYGSNTNNIFPYELTQGIGTSGPFPADVYHGNNNGELTAVELYRYVYEHIKHRQTPGLYPQDSDYVLFKR